MAFQKVEQTDLKIDIMPIMPKDGQSCPRTVNHAQEWQSCPRMAIMPKNANHAQGRSIMPKDGQSCPRMVNHAQEWQSCPRMAIMPKNGQSCPRMVNHAQEWPIMHYSKATIPPTEECLKNNPVQQISNSVQILSILHFISFNSNHSIECTEKKRRAQSKKTKLRLCSVCALLKGYHTTD